MTGLPSKKSMLAALLAASTVLVVATTAWGSPSTDTGDKFSLPAGTRLTATSKKLTVVAGTLKVTCTKFVASGTIPSSGLTIALKSAAIGGCTGTGGPAIAHTATDSMVMTEIDSPTETGTEPNTGDRMTVAFAKDGVSWLFNGLPGCNLTIAPSAPATMTGTYNDVSTIPFKGATVPVSVTSQCKTSAKSATVTATVVLSKSVHDVS
jgi:hypothetical protein